MDETVRKERLCYRQFKNQGEEFKPWKCKDKNKTIMESKRLKIGYLNNSGKDHQ